MKKLKGLIHEFILIICIFSFCVCYFCCGTPMEVMAFSNVDIVDRASMYGQMFANKAYQRLISIVPDFDYSNHNQFLVKVWHDYKYEYDYFAFVVFIPNDVLSRKINDSETDLNEFRIGTSTSKEQIHYFYCTYDSSNDELSCGNYRLQKDYTFDNYIRSYGFSYLFGNVNLSDGSKFNNTVLPDYCTFTYLTDHEKLTDLLVEINTTPEAKQTVTVSTKRGSAITCTDKATNKVYTVGEYPIINGVPSFALGHPKCKDEQIPTSDNNYFFQKDVPTENNEEYHAVCEYDNQLVYEYKEGSTGGGIDPDDVPDYGIFTPLVQLLKGIGYWFLELIKGLFELLFNPAPDFISNKFNDLYTRFSDKFPFIAQIKPLSESFISMVTNSNTAPPDFTITLPEFAGGQTVTVVDLKWFNEYRAMIHAGILFFTYSIFILRLPRRVASAIGGTTS